MLQISIPNMSKVKRGFIKPKNWKKNWILDRGAKHQKFKLQIVFDVEPQGLCKVP